MKTRTLTPILAVLVLASAALAASAVDLTTPLATADLVIEESGGVLAFEAEHFYKQTLTEKRA